MRPAACTLLAIVAFCSASLVVYTHPLLAQPAGLSAGEKMAWQVSEDVVRVTTTSADGSAGEEGFGFVFGEADGKIYIVTADHVVRRAKTDSPDGPLGEGSEKVQVIFKSDQGHRYNADLLDLQLLPSRGDLAVLELSKPTSFTPQWPPLADADHLVPGIRAWRIGKVERWIPASVPGEFVGRSALWLSFDNLDTPRGSSGGPVVTEDGIVGMIVAEGGLSGLPSDVLPVGTIAGVLQGWQLPWNLHSGHSAPTAELPPVPDTTPQPPASVTSPNDNMNAAADAELALAMTEADRHDIQHRLNQLGFAAGDEDGRFGTQTREAIKAYQTRSGLPVSGYVDAIVQARLASDGSRAATAPSTSAVTSIPTMDDTGLKRFALRYFAMLSAPGVLDYLRQSSADSVRYYGHQMNREQFLAQESSAFERWPERSFVVRGNTLKSSCDGGGSCTASGTADYSLRSAQRRAAATGSIRFSIGIVQGASGAPLITALDSLEAPGVNLPSAPPPTSSLTASSPLANADTRWTTRSTGDCSARFYVWHITTNTFTFIDQSGQTDVERVADRNGDTVVTQTVSSTHLAHPTAAGTRWSYNFQIDGRVKVRNIQDGNAFTLTRCVP